MRKTPIVAVDVDDVVLDLAGRWFALYSEAYGDDFAAKDVTTWDVETIVDPRCGLHIYDFLLDGMIYDRVDPVVGAHFGLTTLRALGARVVFVTTTVGLGGVKKREALERYGFLTPHPVKPWLTPDYIIATDKTLVAADFLVDDAPHNVEPWGDRGILFDAGRHPLFYHTTTYRRQNWADVVATIAAALAPESTCEEAQRLVHGPRQADYGHPYDNDARIAALMRAQFGWPVEPTDVWQLMVLTKLSRERAHAKRDNRVDIAGYAEVGELVHERRDAVIDGRSAL